MHIARICLRCGKGFSRDRIFFKPVNGQIFQLLLSLSLASAVNFMLYIVESIAEHRLMNSLAA
jgi:hypothetical protein